jgi:hypothetical protein
MPGRMYFPPRVIDIASKIGKSRICPTTSSTVLLAVGTLEATLFGGSDLLGDFLFIFGRAFGLQAFEALILSFPFLVDGHFALLSLFILVAWRHMNDAGRVNP